MPATGAGHEYLPEVLGTGEFAERDEFFQTHEAASLLFGLLMHHWNAVGEAFRNDGFFLPLLLEDHEGKAYGNNWAIGFMRGVNMREDAWKEIFDDESKISWFFPILTLADELLPDDESEPRPELLPEKPVINDEDREKLLMAVSGGVTDMYRYFAPHRQRTAALAANSASLRKQKNKIGRNDPCYCGWKNTKMLSLANQLKVMWWNLNCLSCREKVVPNIQVFSALVISPRCGRDQAVSVWP